jgi:hypothetical protein
VAELRGQPPAPLPMLTGLGVRWVGRWGPEEVSRWKNSR